MEKHKTIGKYTPINLKRIEVLGVLFCTRAYFVILQFTQHLFSIINAYINWDIMQLAQEEIIKVCQKLYIIIESEQKCYYNNKKNFKCSLTPKKIIKKLNKLNFYLDQK